MKKFICNLNVNTKQDGNIKRKEKYSWNLPKAVGAHHQAQ